MHRLAYPILIQRLADSVSYEAILPDFNNQMILVKGNPFQEVRRWIRQKIKESAICPFPSKIEMIAKREEQMIIFVSMKEESIA